METCVKYAPENDNVLGVEHYEIWQGLPTAEYQFESATTRGGRPALMVEKKECYIWMFPDAMEAYRQNKNSLFSAIGKRIGGKIHFTVELAKEQSLDNAREKAIRLNLNIEKAQKKKARVH